MGHGKHGLRRKVLAPLALAAIGTAFIAPATAWADPPSALPASAPDADKKWQPAIDFDNDGCYSTPAIGPDGTVNPGLDIGGAVNGHCHDPSDLANTNVYSRSKCNNGWCAYMYAYYFEKDQTVDGAGGVGHKHDWEHIVVWVQNDQAKYVAVSQHNKFDIQAVSSGLQFQDTHPKVVYQKAGGGSHDFRQAKTDGGDEPPENQEGKWQIKGLVGWDNFPSGIRDKLVKADFGDATLKLTDDRFNGTLSSAKGGIADIGLDPNA